MKTATLPHNPHFKPGKPNPKKSLFFVWLVTYDEFRPKRKYYSFFDTDSDSLTADKELDRMCYRLHSDFGSYKLASIFVNQQQGFSKGSTESNQLPANVKLCTMFATGDLVFETVVDANLKVYMEYFIKHGAASGE